MRGFWILLAAVATGLTPAPQAVAATADQLEKVNIAGRQRMLSQQIAKAVCMTHLDAEAERHRAMALSALDEFDTVLLALRDGGGPAGFAPMDDPTIRNDLTEVTILWSFYASAIAYFITNPDAAGARLAEVAEVNLPVLAEMHEVVELLDKRYTDPNLPPDTAHTVNVAGRQRMLSQKASKELCLMAAGVDAQANQAALAETVVQFDRALAELRAGSAANNVIAPVSDAQIQQYETVEQLWRRLKPAFDRAASRGRVDPQDLQLVVRHNDSLLREMNRAVGMYTQ